MKGLIFSCSFLAFIFAAVVGALISSKEAFVIPIEQKQIEKLREKIYILSLTKGRAFEKFFDQDGSVISVVNAFADDLFVNIGKYCVKNGFDPIPLNDVKESISGSTVTLTDGSLDGISTLTRNGDVSLTYSKDKKVLTIDAPIKFDNVDFKYHYDIKLFLVTLSSGELIGKINNLRISISLTFDFNSYIAKVNEFNLMNSGHIEVDFDSGLAEQVVTILSNLVTTVLHPLLVTVIQLKVEGVVNDVVNSVNHAINATVVSPNNANHNYLLGY